MNIFKQNKQWNSFLKILESWKGTPYKHMQKVKKRGADCTLFVGSCFQEFGMMGELHYDYYPKDWHMHTKDEIVLTHILLHLETELSSEYTYSHFNEVDEYKRGDIITFALTDTKVSNHVAIVCEDGFFMHSINSRGVTRGHMDEYALLHVKWKEAVTNIFRLEYI